MLRQLVNRRVSLLGLLTATALVIPMAVSSTTPVLASATAPPKCHLSQLVAWMGIPGSGAAGSTYYPIEFTNVSSTTCTLYGFPGVSAWANGHLVGSPASWVHTVATRTVTLRPEVTAHTVFRVVNVGNYPYSVCRPVTATAIKVYPPDNTRASVIQFRLRACSATGIHYLDVWGPIRARVGIPGQ